MQDNKLCKEMIIFNIMWIRKSGATPADIFIVKINTRVFTTNKHWKKGYLVEEEKVHLYRIYMV